MANCPICQSQLSEDFGLVECPSCGAQLIMHMDGSVESQDAKVEEGFSFGAPEDEEPSDFEPQKTEVVAPPAPPLNEDSDNDATALVYQPPGATPDSPDLSDIAAFGNSENARTSDGSLRYTVFVTGIDTADVREAFREAITDRKLVWDIDQILRSLKNGEVAIENVTPPKAHILITRLRNLPVNVRWEQYAISQT